MVDRPAARSPTASSGRLPDPKREGSRRSGGRCSHGAARGPDAGQGARRRRAGARRWHVAAHPGIRHRPGAASAACLSADPSGGAPTCSPECMARRLNAGASCRVAGVGPSAGVPAGHRANGGGPPPRDHVVVRGEVVARRVVPSARSGVAGRSGRLLGVLFFVARCRCAGTDLPGAGADPAARLKMSSSSVIERRSRSMSQWVRAGFSAFGLRPVTVLAEQRHRSAAGALPHRRHRRPPPTWGSRSRAPAGMRTRPVLAGRELDAALVLEALSRPGVRRVACALPSRPPSLLVDASRRATRVTITSVDGQRRFAGEPLDVPAPWRDLTQSSRLSSRVHSGPSRTPHLAPCRSTAHCHRQNLSRSQRRRNHVPGLTDPSDCGSRRSKNSANADARRRRTEGDDRRAGRSRSAWNIEAEHEGAPNQRRAALARPGRG